MSKHKSTVNFDFEFLLLEKTIFELVCCFNILKVFFGINKGKKVVHRDYFDLISNKILHFTNLKL